LESSKAGGETVLGFALETIETGSTIGFTMITIDAVVACIEVASGTARLGPGFAAQLAAPLKLVDAEFLNRLDQVFVVAVALDEVGHARTNVSRK
jgi:hypothetical protein